MLFQDTGGTTWATPFPDRSKVCAWDVELSTRIDARVSPGFPSLPRAADQKSRFDFEEGTRSRNVEEVDNPSQRRSAYGCHCKCLSKPPDPRGRLLGPAFRNRGHPLPTQRR